MGPLSVHVRTDCNSISLSGTVLLELEAALDSGYSLDMPKVDKVLQQFGIVDWDNMGDRLGENNALVRTYQYRLEPFVSGTHAIPSFLFEFVDVNDPNQAYTLETEPFDIEVTSLLDEDRAKLTIEDIDEVVNVPKPPVSIWIWVGCGAGGLLVAIIGIGLYLHSKKPSVLLRIFKPAHEIAYEHLRMLVADNLVEQNQIKQFYERISTILRHYIEHRFDLRAPEQTTEEFLHELKHTSVLSLSDKESLGDFMSHCDLVKFAQHQPATTQIQETFDLVKAFIEKTKSDDKKIDVTDAAQAHTPGGGSV
jgi:hypothetical protein